MRALFVILLIVGAMGFVVGCGSDVTEVAWKNSSASGEKITDISWNTGETIWSGVYANNDTPSESKEVAKTNGDLTCLIWDGAAYTESQFTVEGKGNATALTVQAFSLNEGESQTFTITAN